MIVSIEHCTRYRYARPVILQPHQLIMTPRDGGDQTSIQQSLRCEPKADISWTLDTFGNLIATATFTEPASHLTIISEAVVNHRAPAWPIISIDPDAHVYPFTYTLDDIIDLGALAQPDWITPGGKR